jgi:hypothetical protein
MIFVPGPDGTTDDFPNSAPSRRICSIRTTRPDELNGSLSDYASFTFKYMFPRDNAESWQQIYQFIDEFPDDAYWSQWKPMVRDFVSTLDARGLVTSFRVGQSMHHIIFSTIDHHRLTFEPRVTLEFDPKERTVRVAFSYSNLHFHEPQSQETVPLSTAVSSTLGYLRRLWCETKPATPIPDALNVA